jgi:hypothetical protein
MSKREPEGYRKVPDASEAPGGRADLTPREYAALRRCTLSTVYRRISAGCVTAYKLGGSTIITLDSVDAETERNLIRPKAAA